MNLYSRYNLTEFEKFQLQSSNVIVRKGGRKRKKFLQIDFRTSLLLYVRLEFMSIRNGHKFQMDIQHYQKTLTLVFIVNVNCQHH